jgi:hypothetical protein
MVERLMSSEPVNARALAREVGMSHSTLSRWLLQASTLASMGSKKDVERSGSQKSPRNWSGVEKLQVVLEAAGIPDAELGEFLRKKGIHEADLKAWREIVTKSAADALEGGEKAAKLSSADARRIKELEQALAQKDKRLRSVNALLELQKKVREIWGDEEEPTPRRSEP